MSYHFLTRTMPFSLHRQRVQHELLAAGVTPYGMIKSSSRYLPRIINENEHIKAVIYGVRHSSLVMVAATNQRIIYLDKKPMSVHEDEISYAVASGVQLEVHTFFATVVLHTAIDNYRVRFVNLKCADRFAQYIEERIKEAKEEKAREEQLQEAALQKRQAGKTQLEKLQKFEPNYLYWMGGPDEDEH